MSDASFRLVYLTAGDAEEARKLARILVSERLAACVNVLGSIDSMYWWNDRVEISAEVSLIAKTTADRVAALIKRVKTIHHYECPCVVVLPILDGNPDFLAWIAQEAAPRGESNP